MIRFLSDGIWTWKRYRVVQNESDESRTWRIVEVGRATDPAGAKDGPPLIAAWTNQPRAVGICQSSNALLVGEVASSSSSSSRQQHSIRLTTTTTASTNPARHPRTRPPPAAAPSLCPCSTATPAAMASKLSPLLLRSAARAAARVPRQQPQAAVVAQACAFSLSARRPSDTLMVVCCALVPIGLAPTLPPSCRPSPTPN